MAAITQLEPTGVPGRRYGDFSGKSALITVNGPFFVVECDIFVAGLIEAESFVPGVIVAEVYAPGVSVAEVYASGIVDGEVSGNT